jgi:hypothetical protein
MSGNNAEKNGQENAHNQVNEIQAQTVQHRHAISARPAIVGQT